MDASDLTFVGGLILGFASSLHCAGMCGGIAATVMFAFGHGDDRAARARVLLTSQAGRILSYVLAGTFLGALGSQFYGAFDQAIAHAVIRWAAATALCWIGLSMVGFAPSVALLDRLGAPILRLLDGNSRLAAFGAGGPLLAGIAWGFLPCGMVFGALFYAMLSGSGPSGAMVMAGFGLGTLPAVVGTAFGISALRGLGARPQVRVAAGLALIAVGAVSAAIPASTLAALCFT